MSSVCSSSSRCRRAPPARAFQCPSARSITQRRRCRPASADAARRRRGSLSRSSDRPSAWPKVTSRSISAARVSDCCAVGFGGRRLRSASLLPLALLVEDEDDGEDDERGHEREAGAPLDLARQIEQVREIGFANTTTRRPRDRRGVPDLAGRPDSSWDVCGSFAILAGHARKMNGHGEKIVGEGAGAIRTSPPPPSPHARSFTPLLAVAVARRRSIVGVFADTRGSRAAVEQPRPPVGAGAGRRRSAAERGVRSAQAGQPAAAAVRAARAGAAGGGRTAATSSRPNIRKCSATCRAICGCEREGHSGNDDCFVAARNERRRHASGIRTASNERSASTSRATRCKCMLPALRCEISAPPTRRIGPAPGAIRRRRSRRAGRARHGT